MTLRSIAVGSLLRGGASAAPARAPTEELIHGSLAFERREHDTLRD